MIEIVPAYDRLDDIRMLLSEYTEMLLSINYEFRLYLELQRYDDEALNPSEKYAMPYGRLYLALYDGRPAGCIALHRLEGTACEMNRLFVRPPERRAFCALHDLQKPIVYGVKAMKWALKTQRNCLKICAKSGGNRAGGYRDIPKAKGRDFALAFRQFLREQKAP